VKAIVNRRAESLIRHWSHGNPRLGRGIGLVQQIEQPGRGFDQVA
jgi:hypothetical protein